MKKVPIKERVIGELKRIPAGMYKSYVFDPKKRIITIELNPKKKV